MNLFLLGLILLTGINKSQTSLLQVPIEAQTLAILKSEYFKPVALMDNTVIVEALPNGVNVLKQERVDYKTLLKPESFQHAKEHRSFYFVFPPFRKKSESAFHFLTENGEVLSEGDNYYLYLTTQDFAQTLPQIRYEITHISLKPIILPELADNNFFFEAPAQLEFNRGD